MLPSRDYYPIEGRPGEYTSDFDEASFLYIQRGLFAVSACVYVLMMAQASTPTNPWFFKPDASVMTCAGAFFGCIMGATQKRVLFNESSTTNIPRGIAGTTIGSLSCLAALGFAQPDHSANMMSSLALAGAVITIALWALAAHVGQPSNENRAGPSNR